LIYPAAITDGRLRSYNGQHESKQLKDLTAKERIFEEATYLFAKQGFAGTGLRELAAQAGVNLAMINYFFGSKNGLLKEILDHFFAGYLAIAQKELVGSAALQDKLERFMHSAISYFDSNTNALLVTITELPHDDPEIIKHKAAWGKQMAAILEREVCQALMETTGRKIPATCIASMLVSLMASRFLFAPVMQSVRGEAEDPVDIQAYTKIITSLFLRGVLSGK